MIVVTVWLACAAAGKSEVGETATFGALHDGASSVEIAWELGTHAELGRDGLVLRSDARIRCAALPLHTLRLYEVRATMRRDPGLRVQFLLAYTDARGQAQRWGAVWQLPEGPRPDWAPIAPDLQTYVQGFVLPPGAKDPRLELRTDAEPSATASIRGALWLTRLELVAQQRVSCCRGLGDNQLLGADMETPLHDGLPIGWSRWDAAEPGSLTLVELQRAPKREHALRVSAGKAALIASTAPIAVARGSAWRISLRVRGRGQVDTLAHPLGDELLRVGDPQDVSFQVASRGWKPLETIWFAQAPGVKFAQVVLLIQATSDLEVDQVEFRPYR